MTAARLPRTARGCALPRSDDTATVSWPPALRGRSTLLCLLLLGWLGGGLVATAVAVVAGSPDELASGLTNAVAAALGLLLLTAAGLRRSARRRPATVPTPEPVTAAFPQQAGLAHDDRREPALG